MTVAHPMEAIDGDYSRVLRGHAIVEASAGTGKTYTIENLVLQILLDYPEIPISGILIVTFTEKAAGELKERVRTRLEKALLTADPQHAATLSASLEQFDSAAISTIHGFCNGVLNEFPFENARPLQLETGSDGAARARILADIIRNEWPKLPDRPAETGGGAGDEGAQIIAEALGLQRAIVDGAGKLREGDYLICEDSLISESELVGLEGIPMESIRSSQKLAMWTLAELGKRVRESRMASATISYDDMITDVRRALVSGTGKDNNLPGILRRRFRFALVDEFQDTDPDQWDIFRRIFVDYNEPYDGRGNGNTLIVVGDPKQAIYGFRGADVRTYLKASEEITTRRGFGFKLEENRRSLPALIEGFNAIFRSPGWFDQPVAGRKDPIGYHPSIAPAGSPAERTIVSDRSGRGAVVPVWMSKGSPLDELKFTQAKRRYGAFIAAEIKRLMDPGAGIVLCDNPDAAPDERRMRGVSYDDFCVLVPENGDISPISEGLDDAGIPWAGYKQRTLYSSPEADDIRVLLEALAAQDGDRQAGSPGPVMFTRLFFPGGEIAALSETERIDFIRRRLAGWRQLAQNRQWEKLFETVAHQTSLFFREGLERGGERKLSNWRQIFEELVAAADEGSLDARGLVRHLAGLGARRGDDGDDALISRLESEVPRVRFITCHSAKGLQFPFVFVSGGFRTAKAARGAAWCYSGDGRRCLILLPARGGRIPDGYAIDSDENRLFYVALTRAKFKVYFPVGWKPKKGASPVLDLFTAGLGALVTGQPDDRGVWTLVDTGGRLRDPVSKDVIQDEAAAPVPVSGIVGGDPARQEESPEFNLSPSVRVDWFKRSLHVHSYSSLATHGGKKSRKGPVPEGARDDRDDDDTDDDDDLTPPPEILLSAGKKTGTALHGIMEALAGGKSDLNPDGFDFGTFRGPEDGLFERVGGLVRLHLEKNRIPNRQGRDANGNPDGADRQMTRLVCNALRTRLSDTPPLCFSVSEVQREDLIAEVEFHVDAAALGISPKVLAAANAASPGGDLLNGFIDLIFRRDGRYWFLDWKTTTIRPDDVEPEADGSVDEWSPAAVGRAMNDSGYLIQAHVYRIAMLEWLGRIYGEKAADMFGGGIFLFVRGMTAPGRAVWSSVDLFERESIEASRKLIASRMMSKAGFGGGDEQ